MTKQIVFTVSSSGVDGRGQSRIEFASLNEQERDTWHQNHKNKNWHHAGERIVDLISEKKAALSHLDALQKLALGIEQPQCKGK